MVMEAKIESIESDLKLLDDYIADLEEKKKRLEEENLKKQIIIDKLKKESK